MEDPKVSTGNIQIYLKEQNIELTFDRTVTQAMNGMTQGLFASLLIDTIIGTTEKLIPGPADKFCKGISKYTGQTQGATMVMATGYALQCPPYTLLSLATVGFAINALDGAGGPLAVYFILLIAIFLGKLVLKRTVMNLSATPTVTIVVGIMAANFLVPPAGVGVSVVGYIIMWATEQQPPLTGVPVATIVGIAPALSINSAIICTALSLVGLAEGATAAGCYAQMMGPAVCSYRENRVDDLSSIGLGTVMLMLPDILKKPVLWLPPLTTGVTTGPIATCVFRLKVNDTSISSGVGTCGLVGSIGVVTGWLSPDRVAILINGIAASPVLKDWIGSALACFALPALPSSTTSEFIRKKGWIQQGDYALMWTGVCL